MVPDGNLNNESCESYTTFSYDFRNRLTQAVDSVAGTITRSYDDVNRKITETTPTGAIAWNYDPDGRRTSMTVAGQSQINYGYDADSRLTSITQGSSVVQFGYDPDSRRNQLTLPNGVTVTYGYDQGSRLTGLTYNLGSSTLGNLTYAYDALNRRTQMGGSFAQTNLPQPIASAAYDAANELTAWNEVPMSYDQNGNLVNDGVNSYTWDARNQLSAIGADNVVSYDGLGRRTESFAGTSFLYDGWNAVQELSGSTVTANRTTGAVDEFFNRADSTGTYYPLTDALGSVVALTNSSGAIVTQYAYEPYGSTTTSGTSNSNFFGYTGRENEGNGLYYYRARYYSLRLGRFISEDPIHFRGGFNFYAYGGDSPLQNIDPSGQSNLFVHAAETYVASRAAGYGNLGAMVDAVEVVAVDFGTQGTDANSTSVHAMAGTLDDGNMETADQAYQRAQQAADAAAARGDEATAIHDIQDSFAHDYQPDHSKNIWAWPCHAIGDWIPHPDAVIATYEFLKNSGRKDRRARDYLMPPTHGGDPCVDGPLPYPFEPLP